MMAFDTSGLEPLVASLLARAPRMNFMQLCQLLERTSTHGFGMRDTPEREPVRFRPQPSVGFPAAELAGVEPADEITESSPRALNRKSALPPTLRTTFLGLYGVDAAMPSSMIDEIVLREEGHEVVEAFLDQFNHRVVVLLYRAWKKYRYPESFLPGGQDDHSRQLLSVAGFGWGDKPQRAGLPDSRMLAMLGALVQKTRTAEGLSRVIALAAPGVGVRVDEFWATTTPAGLARPLSSTPQAAEGVPQRGLGGGYVLGRRLSWRARVVRVTLKPQDARQAHELLPGMRVHRELMAVMQLYVGIKVDVHLRMVISSRLIPQTVVSHRRVDPSPRLGWTTVLPSEAERTIAVPLGMCKASTNTPGGTKT